MAERVIAVLDRDCLAKFKLSLNRNGVLILEPELSHANVSNLNWEKEATHAYYFLRDIVHTHQHHDEEVDTMLGIYKVSDDDSDWFI